MKINAKYGIVAALTMAAFVAPSVGALDWGTTTENKSTDAAGEVTIAKTAQVTLETKSTLVIDGHTTYSGETIADVLQSAVIKDGTGSYTLADKATDVYKDAGLTFTWDGDEVAAAADTGKVAAGSLATAGDHTVTVSDGTTTTKSITVKIAKKTISASSTATAKVGTKGDKDVTYTGSNITDFTYYLDGVKLAASDIASATFKNSKDETVSNIKDAGTYSVNLKVKEGANIELDGDEDTTNAQLDYKGTIVVAPADISKKTATLSDTTYTYNGEEKEPTVASIAGITSPVAYDKDETAAAHTKYDYKVTYTNNINVGTATATITGHGNYTGTITKTFTINKAVISGDTATVPATSAIYRGTAVTPKKVTVGGITLNDGFTMTITDKSLDLVNVTDTQIPFTVSVDGKNVSTTSAGISGKFTITQLDLSTGTVHTKAADIQKTGVEILVIDPAYTGSEVLPTVKVFVDGDEVPASEYKIVSATAATAKGAAGVVTLQKSDTAKTANVTGTKSLNFTVSDTASISDATISGIARAYTYNGESKEPAVSVSMNGATLVEGTDYVVVYKNNLKVGTATVTIKGTGSYTGSVSKSFYIDPAKSSIKKVAVAAKKMTVTVKKGTAASGVQIAYRVKGTTKWSYVKTTGTSKTISSLKKGKKYQVVVRSYTTKSGKVTNYSGWSATKTTAAIK